jgi:putative acetyltransferase
VSGFSSVAHIESTMTIIDTISPQQIETARELFLEYEKELNVDLCFQGFAEELQNLPGKYTSPDGALLFAMEQSKVMGCVALRKLSVSDAEMKRLYVRPVYRHLGVGRQLAEAIVDRARKIGYHRMVLDTLNTMQSAQALYQSLGFTPIDAYYENPLPGVIYFAKELAQ